MGAGRGLAICPPVDFAASVLAAAAEVEPGEGILIGPQKRFPNVGVVQVGVRIALPCIPGIGRERMRRRANAEQVHCRKLAVFVVAELDETLGAPAVREQFAISVGHPGKVVATIKQRRKVGDPMVFMEVLPAGQRSGKEPDAIAGRNLYVLPALTGVDVVEVIEPSVDGEDLAVGVAAKRAADAVFRLVASNPFALRTDAECCKGKAGDAGATARLIAFFLAVGRIAVDEVFAY